MIRTLALLLSSSVAILVFAGCHHSDTNGISESMEVQYGNASESATNQLMDATLSALVLQATGATPPGDPVRTTGAAHLPMHATDRAELTRLASGAFIVNLDQLVDVNGAKLFPDLSGAFTVTPGGTAVTSWPTGSNQQALGTATVVFDQGPINYTDPGDGLVVNISLGSFTLATVATYQYTSLMNWTFSLDAQLAITQNTELTWTAVPANLPTHLITITGFRHVQLTETRSATGGVNSLTIVRTADGQGVPGDPPGGAHQIDPNQPATYFTSFVHGIDITQPDTVSDTWNRLETTTTTWDYTQSPALRTQTIGAQEIFFNRDGAVSGPFSTASLLAAFGTQASN
jgi:hypothetical protein